MPEPTTEELRAEQIARAREQHALASEADRRPEERAHDRRAERAGYLADKLSERAESEERAQDDP